MEKIILEAHVRDSKTKHSVKELRKRGFIPAVIYGKKVGNIPISVSEKDVQKIGGTKLIQVKLPDGNYPAVIQEIHKTPIGGRIEHIDFLQVDVDQKMKTEIPVRLTGTAAGMKDGGIIQYGERTVEIEALPTELPEFLEADITNLEIGDKLTVADLQKTTPLTITSDPDSFLVIINEPRVEEEPAVEGTPSPESTAEEEIQKEEE